MSTLDELLAQEFVSCLCFRRQPPRRHVTSLSDCDGVVCKVSYALNKVAMVQLVVTSFSIREVVELRSPMPHSLQTYHATNPGS